MILGPGSTTATQVRPWFSAWGSFATPLLPPMRGIWQQLETFLAVTLCGEAREAAKPVVHRTAPMTMTEPQMPMSQSQELVSQTPGLLSRSNRQVVHLMVLGTAVQCEVFSAHHKPHNCDIRESKCGHVYPRKQALVLSPVLLAPSMDAQCWLSE